jgi:UDP-N-acetylglucosamine:LPS N-acetylglucosamine transferase
VAEPEFDPARIGVLFFSRGRGRGHAVPDCALAAELRRLSGDVDVRFVSYASGAETFEELGHAVVDLDLPEDNPLFETLIRATRVIGWLKPALVIAHEELPALAAAKILELPAIYIADWFGRPEDIRTSLLAYADEILFLDEPGIFAEPVQAAGRVHYVGPVLRPVRYTKQDRLLARQELGIPVEDVVITVLPGSWTEKKAPILSLVLAAFDLLPERSKTLVWIAGEDYGILEKHVHGKAGIVLKQNDWQMDRLMAASNVAITKATRQTSMELAALGIPSISLSHGLNRIDDIRVKHIPTNTALQAGEVTADQLAATIADILKSRDNVRDATTNTGGEANTGATPAGGRVLAAQRLAWHVERIASQPKTGAFEE